MCLSRVLAALLATHPMLGFSFWCVVLLLHWSEAATGSRAGGERGMYPPTDCQILTGYHPGRRVAREAATGI